MTSSVPWDTSSGSHGTETAGEGDSLATIESDIYRTLQSIFRQLDNQTSAPWQIKGVLRWTLHKKVQENPKHCVILLKILVKQLEKVKRLQYRNCIVPLLHTLIYAVYQSVYIPDELCQRAYDVCKQLLTLPHPYCTIGLAYAKLIKMEQTTPGALYQRRILTEQRMQTGTSSKLEQVFVFADPAVLPDFLATGVAADLDPAAVARGGLDHMSVTVLHTLQRALGQACHGPVLKQALQNIGDRVELFFREVVSTLAEHTQDSAADRGSYCARLQQIYSKILAAAKLDPPEGGLMCNCPLPNPEMSFEIWREDNELWGAVAKFIHTSSMNKIQEEEARSAACLPTRSQSVSSAERRTPRDLCHPGTWDQPSLNRRLGQRRRLSPLDRLALMMDTLEEPQHSPGVVGPSGTTGAPLPKNKRPFTVHIVVMGDDRTVGRLAKAYHSLRQREARRLFLTTKVSLELYYIPVTNKPSGEENIFHPSNLAVSSYLGRIDPWYECNVNSLRHMIPRMEKKLMSPSKMQDPDSFLPDVISYYIRTATLPVSLTIYSVKIFFANPEINPVEDVFVCHLEMDFRNIRMIHVTEGSFRITRHMTETSGMMISVKYKRFSVSGREEDIEVAPRVLSASINAIPTSGTEDLNCFVLSFGDLKNIQEPPIRTCDVKIWSPENSAFCICLDKDSRRTFTDVQRVEISHCLDPGFSLQRSSRSQPANFSLGDVMNDKKGLSPTQGLALPVNTFAGVAP